MPIGINSPQTTSLQQSKDSLDSLTAVGGPFHGLTLVLYANNFVPTQGVVLADLTQPTFTGYAPHAAVAFGAADNNPGGGAVSYAPSITFACSGGTPADIIYGWALVDAGLTVVELVVPLATPINIVAVGDAAVIVPQLTWGGR